MPSEANISRKRCERDAIAGKFFLSLVDYRNNLFTSNNPDDVIKFYESFQSRDDLIEWMRERPKGVANIYEVDGDKEIIVVIPTADFNGRYAKECREKIFKGLHIVFVESGEVPDPYFNYAHNCNVGIKKAMEYKPKWIVVSNDDMKAKSPPEILKEELRNFSNFDYDAVLVNDPNVSLKIYVATRTFMTKFLDFFYNKRRNDYYMKGFAILEKFGLKYYFVGNRSSLFYHRITDFINVGAFCCYSSIYCESVQGELYDETFINSTEDYKQGILLSTNRKGYAFFKKYNIEDLKGRTMPITKQRWLRDLAGKLVLDYQIRYILKCVKMP